MKPLKTVYEEAGLAHRYFDYQVPCALFRGQSISEGKKRIPIIHPNPGFTRADGRARIADVLIEEVSGKKIVRGCCTISGP